MIVLIQSNLDAIEKYGILGLLYVVLAAIGFFILRTGGKMVDAINANTMAVTKLTGEITVLVRQHEDQAEEDRRQLDANTKQVMDAIKDGLRDVREELQRRPPNA